MRKENESKQLVTFREGWFQDNHLPLFNLIKNN